MKPAKNIKLILAAVVWIGIAAAFASAQVIKQVPSNALAVLKVSDLEATSKKVADFAAAMGISQMDPDMADPLGAFLKAVGVTEGINRSGELAFAFIDPAAFNSPEDKSMLLLIPVSDYQKFIGNFADAKPDGDLTQAHFKNQTGDLTYFAHWGDYAAASPTRDIVAKPPTDIIQVDGLAAKELDGKDIVLLGNLKGLRPKMLQEIDRARQQAPGDIDQMISQAMKTQNQDATKFAPLAKELAGQILDFAQKFAESADAASLSLNLSPDGIASTLMCQFDPASSLGIDVTQVKNTDESLLGGLATGKYLMFGGASPQQVALFWAKFLPPVQKAITDLGPDYSSLNDWLNALQKMSTASTGSTFGMLMPQAQPGQGGADAVRQHPPRRRQNHARRPPRNVRRPAEGFQSPGADHDGHGPDLHQGFQNRRWHQLRRNERADQYGRPVAPGDADDAIRQPDLRPPGSRCVYRRGR